MQIIKTPLRCKYDQYQRGRIKVSNLLAMLIVIFASIPLISKPATLPFLCRSPPQRAHLDTLDNSANVAALLAPLLNGCPRAPFLDSAFCSASSTARCGNFFESFFHASCCPSCADQPQRQTRFDPLRSRTRPIGV